MEKILNNITGWMLKVTLNMAFLITTFVIVTLAKYSFKFAVHYCKYAVIGIGKILWYPRYAPVMLITSLLSFADAKFFYNTYTFNNYKYSEYLHFIILILPFVYLYHVGRKQIIDVDASEKEKKDPIVEIKINQPLLKKQPDQPVIEQPVPNVREKDDWKVKDAKIIDAIDVKSVEE